jgi:uncharacterized membrane protein YphA (DoxX/SURF4 family)
MRDRPSLLRRADQTGIPLLLTRVVLAGLFLYMGTVKVLDPVEFLKLIREYHLVPESPPVFLNLMAVVFPWVEVVCALTLLSGLSVRGASVTLLALLMVFTGAVLLRSLSMYGSGGVAYCDIKFDCGCGSGDVYICSKLLENSGLIVLALIGMLSRSRRFCLSTVLLRGPQPAPTSS